jgi:hypothetical protein
LLKISSVHAAAKPTGPPCATGNACELVLDVFTRQRPRRRARPVARRSGDEGTFVEAYVSAENGLIISGEMLAKSVQSKHESVAVAVLARGWP